jgi:predicted aspartyl protease
MEIATMGRVTVEARIENIDDLYEVEKGERTADAVRSVTVPDALVDTGATALSLPKRYVAQLGLRKSRTRTARTPAGTVSFNQYLPVKLTVQGRDCYTEVCEVPDDCPVLIGQIPLEILDFVVDPVGQQLIGNPAHGGEQMIELY